MLALLLLQAAAPAPAAAPAAAPWAVQTRANGTNVSTSSSAWSSDAKARLVVRCDVTNEKIVSIQFIPKPGFAAAVPRPVSINVDDGGWLGTNWQFPGSGAFISNDAVVSNLSVMIAHGKSIRVRVIDPEEKVVEAQFAGPGEAPIRQVLSACGYEFGKAPSRGPAPSAAGPATPEASDDQ